MGQHEVYKAMQLLPGKWLSVQDLEIIMQVTASTIRTSLKKLARWKFIEMKNSIKEISYTTHDGRDMTVNKKVILWCCNKP